MCFDSSCFKLVQHKELHCTLQEYVLPYAIELVYFYNGKGKNLGLLWGLNDYELYYKLDEGVKTVSRYLGELIPGWAWKDTASFSFVTSCCSSTSSLTSFSLGGIFTAMGVRTVFLMMPLREFFVNSGICVWFSFAFLSRGLLLCRDAVSSGSSEKMKSTAVGTSGVCKSCILFAELEGFKDFQSAHVLEVGLIWAGFNPPCSLLSSRTWGHLGIIYWHCTKGCSDDWNIVYNRQYTEPTLWKSLIFLICWQY